jgi:peptide/nickel transport system ATP-binding protein
VTSALDTVVGAAVLDLLAELRRELGVSYMFISHDISTVRAVCDEVAVLYAGCKVDAGSRKTFAAPPYHPYADLLISSVPELRTGWLDGLPPRAIAEPGMRDYVDAAKGLCVFRDRCPVRIDGVCDREAPPRRAFEGGKEILCHHTSAELERLQSNVRPSSMAPGPKQAAVP